MSDYTVVDITHLLPPYEDAPGPHQLWWAYVADIGNMGPPPRCFYRLDGEDFLMMADWWGDFWMRTIKFNADLAAFLATNSHKINTSAFDFAWEDLLAEGVGALQAAAEEWNNTHIGGATTHTGGAA